MEKYLINLGNAVEYADSPEDLADRLYRVATSRKKYDKLTEGQMEIMDLWVGNPDGAAKETVRKEIDSVVGKNIRTPFQQAQNRE